MFTTADDAAGVWSTSGESSRGRHRRRHPRRFLALWADDREQERTALTRSSTGGCRAAAHPDMHIYHYAPYEITALKRLVAEHKTHEDDARRAAAPRRLRRPVRRRSAASVRVSQPSYSIKKLEPLYMGDGCAKAKSRRATTRSLWYHQLPRSSGCR